MATGKIIVAGIGWLEMNSTENIDFQLLAKLAF